MLQVQTAASVMMPIVKIYIIHLLHFFKFGSKLVIKTVSAPPGIYRLVEKRDRQVCNYQF